MSLARMLFAVSQASMVALVGLSVLFAQDSIIVTTAAQLEAALSPSNEGRTILVRAGTYDVDSALVVPDRASLIGEGVMSFDGSGLPDGFLSPGRTVLRSTFDLTGDVLTLGDGSSLRGLTIEDFPGRVQGNVVVASSRTAGDAVAATITECEIINPNQSQVALQGPAGRGLLIVTRNLNFGLAPPPHEGSVMTVHMTRSIVRAPGGGSGVFASNFASDSRIRLFLSDNVIGGGLDASAAASRPDRVTGARTDITSHRNVYRSDTTVPTSLAWQLIGGLDAPVAGLISDGASFNSMHLMSVDDRLEGFARGISAVAGRRSVGLSGPSSGNTVDLDLHGTRLRLLTSDLMLFGARSLAAGVGPGNNNGLRVLGRGVIGSGPRTNQYAHSAATATTDLGFGNWLEIVGNPNAFARTNHDVLAPPSGEFFTTWR